MISTIIMTAIIICIVPAIAVLAGVELTAHDPHHSHVQKYIHRDIL